MAFPRIARSFQEYAGSRAFTPANANFSSMGGGGRARYVAPPKVSTGNAGAFLRRAMFGQRTINGGRVYAGTFPLGIGAGVGLATRGITGIGRGITRLAKSDVLGGGAKTVLGRTASRGLKAYAIIEAGEYFFKKGAGEKYKPSVDPAGIVFSGLTPISPIVSSAAFLGGKAYGLTKTSSRLAQDVLGKIGTPNIPNFTPDTRLYTPAGTPTVNVGQPSISYGGTNVYMTPLDAPQIPAGVLPSSSASFAPSVSVGGGGGMGELALLALLAGGGAGYLLGRKKKRRKKQKYKKRRRR